MGEWTDLIKLTVALLAIVDPVASVPIFLTTTTGYTQAERRRVTQIVALTVFGVLAGAALVGTQVLQFFGISVSSFQIAGGILLLLMAISMLQARESGIRQTPDEAEEAAEKDAVAVVPLAIPLLAGPGAIGTMIISAHHSERYFDSLALLVPAALIAAVVWATFMAATRISSRLGKTGMNIITRVMGLIIAAIGVEYIYRGLIELFPETRLMAMVWKPDVTVAAIVEREGRFLLVEEQTESGLLFNQPAGHLEDQESLQAAVIRETLEETAWDFMPEELVGIYRWRAPERNVTYLRFAFCGRLGSHHAQRKLDEGIVRAVWQSPSEIRAGRDRHRSPLVVRCVEDYLSGKRAPLDLLSDMTNWKT